MFISRGLVDPKTTLNRSGRKGSRLIFLHQFTFCPIPDTSGQAEHPCQGVPLINKVVENRNGEKQSKILEGGVFPFRFSLVSVKRG